MNNLWGHVSNHDASEEGLHCIGEPGLVDVQHGSLLGFCGRHGLWSWFDGLLARGASPSLPDGDGRPAAWHALRDTPRLHRCLQAGLDVHASTGTREGEGWIQAAIQEHAWDALRLLLEYDAPVSWASLSGDTALHLAATLAATPCWVGDWLLDHGASLHAQDARGWTALHWAVHEDNQSFAYGLARRGANWHCPHQGGITPWQMWQAQRRRPATRGRELDAWWDHQALMASVPQATGERQRSERL